MTFKLKPQHLFLAPFALFLAIEIGVPLANARNAAALPLLGNCPTAVGAMFGGVAGVEATVPIAECAVGLFVLVSIPGAIGIFITAMRSDGVGGAR